MAGATISLNKREATLISVYISGLDKNYTKNDRKIVWYIDGDPDGQDSLDGGVLQSEVWDFTELEPETSYTIQAHIYNSDWSVDVTTASRTITTKAESSGGGSGGDEPSTPTKPSKWSWSKSNGANATSSQTSKAYTTITSKGKTTDFAADVWNDMVDKVSEVRVAAGKSSWTGTGVYSKSSVKADPGDEITAVRFNALIRNLGNYCNMSEVVPDINIVYGSYFKDFADCINDWINDL